MSRRRMANHALIVSFIIDAVANREGWKDVHGWNTTAGIVFIVWLFCLVTDEVTS